MLSLQTIKTHIPNPQKALSLKLMRKRASSSASFLIKGSMTVEGSLVLPLFLFYMGTLLYLIEIVHFQSNVYGAIHQGLSYAWAEVYSAGNLSPLSEGCISENVMAEAKGLVINHLRDGQLSFLCVENGEDGVCVEVKQDVPRPGDLEIEVSYRLKPFIRWLQTEDYILTDTMMIHGFVGYTGGFGSDTERDYYVYVTPSGTKYHRSQTCSYIRVRLLVAEGDRIDVKRNESGEIYRACDICQPEKEGILYYTVWGNRFHNATNCRGIKKNVFMIPLSEVGSRTPCSKCG